MPNPAMPNPEATDVAWVVRLANAISRSILFLIVAACALAFMFPQSAHDLRRLHPPGFESLRLSKVLLAILLFAAGHEIERRQVMAATRRPMVLLLGILLLWGVPLAGMAFLRATGSSFLPADLIAGLAIASLMPAAVSSVSWSILRGGNIALSLTLVFVSILVYPLIAHFAMSAGIVDRTPTPGITESITFVAITMLGAGVRWLFEARRSATAAACLKILSSASLLLLNFINAVAAKPVIRGEDAAVTIALAAIAVALVCGFGYIAAWASTRWLCVDASSSQSIIFGVGMKNTGMALALSETLLADQPIAVLTILFYTLTQHFFAAAYHTFAPMPPPQIDTDPPE